MTEVQDELKQYQWKKGDNFGEVVNVASEDDKFVIFTNGQRIFKSVLSEFLEPVISDNLPFPPTSLGITPAAVKTDLLAKPEPVKENSIMGAMILKMSKKNVVNVPIQINLNIPTPDLYKMLMEGMEEDDLNKEITEVALSQIKIDKLQEYIKSNVTDFLGEYYT